MTMDSIEVGDIVIIGKSGTRHEVLKLSERRPSALLRWGTDDWCWWPLAELSVCHKGQTDLFN